MTAKNAIHRVLISASSNIDSKKDPVYETLKENARFKNLLHELPLYLTNRSLLKDNKKLYDEILTLKNTRDLIAHSLKGNSKRKYLSIDKAGALLAVRTANAAALWYEDTSSYFPP